MSKYDPLHRFLAANPVWPLTLSFTQVEVLLGFELPESALLRPQWWANEKPATTQHSHSRAWTEANAFAQPDFERQTVTFEYRTK
jgi:hypothetical protein